MVFLVTFGEVCRHVLQNPIAVIFAFFRSDIVAQACHDLVEKNIIASRVVQDLWDPGYQHKLPRPHPPGNIHGAFGLHTSDAISQRGAILLGSTQGVIYKTVFCKHNGMHRRTGDRGGWACGWADGRVGRAAGRAVGRAVGRLGSWPGGVPYR